MLFLKVLICVGVLVHFLSKPFDLFISHLMYCLLFDRWTHLKKETEFKIITYCL